MKNLIKPKYKLGQKLWCIGQHDKLVSFVVKYIIITKDNIYYSDNLNNGIVSEKLVYSTEKDVYKRL